MHGDQPKVSKRPRFSGGEQDRRKKSKPKGATGTQGSNEEVLLKDVEDLLSTASATSPEDGTAKDYQPLERFSEVEVLISKQSSIGDGLGLSPDKNHVYVVPFSVPGDLVLAKVINYKARERYTTADFVKVLNPSPQRDDSRIECAYFARCGGCHFQMLTYADQLAHKKTIIERAYANFSNLAPESIPRVDDTVGSPLQYGYRTKLTPHFDGPPGPRRRKNGDPPRRFAETPAIGFNYKNQGKVLDVEDCPIGTDTVRAGLKRERASVTAQLAKYTKGATILLRESTTRAPQAEPTQDSAAAAERAAPDEVKTCITDNNATSTEYVDSYVFENPAGAFFQNNNSILPLVTRHVHDRILPVSSPEPSSPRPQITTLLDAYCGSALFTITLAPLFERSIGIDISTSSIEHARRNAQLNGTSSATFHAATAAALFAELPGGVRPDETAVVIDPPRKGCDADFLRQLLEFAPRRVCYVSCNVHTQARDVGVLVEGLEAVRGAQAAEDGKSPRTRYRIESICGFDFFPQTSHVESVAILERVDE